MEKLNDCRTSKVIFHSIPVGIWTQAEKSETLQTINTNFQLAWPKNKNVANGTLCHIYLYSIYVYTHIHIVHIFCVCVVYIYKGRERTVKSLPASVLVCRFSVSCRFVWLPKTNDRGVGQATRWNWCLSVHVTRGVKKGDFVSAFLRTRIPCRYAELQTAFDRTKCGVAMAVMCHMNV